MEDFGTKGDGTGTTTLPYAPVTANVPLCLFAGKPLVWFPFSLAYKAILNPITGCTCSDEFDSLQKHLSDGIRKKTELVTYRDL